jgi:flagellar basal body-associated protein FliL
MKITRPKSKKFKIVVAVLFIVIAILLGGVIFALNSKDSNENVNDTTSTTQGIESSVNTTPQEQPAKEVDSPAPSVTPTTDPKPPATPPASQWPVQLTNAQASSLAVVVNKKHKLPSTYVPSLTNVSGGQLRTEAC